MLLRFVDGRRLDFAWKKLLFGEWAARENDPGRACANGVGRLYRSREKIIKNFFKKPLKFSRIYDIIGICIK